MITVEGLLADPPKLHIPSSRPAELTNQWKLSDEELLFVKSHVGESSKTLETGAGCSTILFAMLGSRHTCIVPDQSLVDRICAFCKEKQIPTAMAHAKTTWPPGAYTNNAHLQSRATKLSVDR